MRSSIAWQNVIIVLVGVCPVHSLTNSFMSFMHEAHEWISEGMNRTNTNKDNYDSLSSDGTVHWAVNYFFLCTPAQITSTQPHSNCPTQTKRNLSTTTKKPSLKCSPPPVPCHRRATVASCYRPAFLKNCFCFFFLVELLLNQTTLKQIQRNHEEIKLSRRGYMDKGTKKKKNLNNFCCTTLVFWLFDWSRIVW